MTPIESPPNATDCRATRLPAAPGPRDDVAADFAVQILKPAEMPALRDAWLDLCARSLEPNVFFDPDFALAAFRHLQPPRRLRVIVVFAPKAGPERRLVALLPVVLPASPVGGIARAYVHKQAAQGTPLLDRDVAAPALAALIGALMRHRPGISALSFAQIPVHGPTLALLRAGAASRHADVRLFGVHERAVFVGGATANSGGWRRRPRKNTRRQRRRLAERGTVAYRTHIGHAATQAMAAFLALEASGWKGARRTALASASARAAFANEVARLMGARGALRVDSLDLDGKAVAMGIILNACGRSYFWKTAYDETLAVLSPGVLFVREFTERQLSSEPGPCGLIDSCATSDHAMIDRLWPDRAAIADVCVALHPSPLAGGLTLAIEGLRRKVRHMAKRLYLRVREGR